MGKIILYHGTPDKIVVPKFGGEAAYENLKEITDELLAVDYTEFNDRYNQRDITARKRMRELVDSDANTVTKVFSTLFER